MKLTTPHITRITVNGLEIVRIQYSQTLSQYMPVDYLEYLLNESKITIPVYSLYSRKTKNPRVYYSVLGPIKTYTTKRITGGIYVAELDKNKEEYFAEIPLKPYVLANKTTKIEEITSIIPKIPVTVKVTSIQDAFKKLTYTAVNGKEYIVWGLPNIAYGIAIDGFYLTSRVVAIVTSENIEDKVQLGDTIKCYWVYSKAGRGDFAESKTSHQLNVCVR